MTYDVLKKFYCKIKHVVKTFSLQNEFFVSTIINKTFKIE